MKKITCALLASAALSTAFASAPSATGFYVGGSAGMSNTSTKYGYTNSNLTGSQNGKSIDATHLAPATSAAAGSAITAGQNQNYKNEAGKINPQFGLFTGYGMQFGQAYVGAELHFGFDSAKTVAYNDQSTDGLSAYWKSSVERKMAYGLAVRGGYFVTPSTMLYVRAGIEAGKWKAKVDASNMQKLTNANVNAIGASTVAVGLSATAGTPYSTPNSQAALEAVKQSTKNSLAFVTGLGLEVYLTKNLFMRAEYNYLFGPSIKFNQNVDALTAVYGTTLTHTHKITQNQFKVGVGYKF